MTFVAQPYERFADDLLTMLTGGVAREEHRFVGADQSYSLASPDIRVSSIKVYGQRSEAFLLFDPRNDYRYDPNEQAIFWRPDGSLPDDHSYFYVSYYPTEMRPRLTDRNPGSVLSTLSGAFARQFAVLHKQMEMIYQSAFVDTATGASLDHVAALLGLTRKDAKFASGEALFTRSVPATGDITIAAGTLVSTEQGQTFEVTDTRALRRGQLSALAPLRAQVEGPAGRVEAGAITIINRPIFGIEAVTNEQATFFTAEKETDEELRRRIRGTLERAGKSSVDAIKYGLIEDLPEVTENNVQIVERQETPGFVEVRLGVEATDNPDLARRVEEAIFNSRAAGIRVMHNLATRTPSDSAQRAGEQPALPKINVPSAVHLTDEVLRAMPEGVLKLQAEARLRLVERNLSVAQKEKIEDTARAAITEYVAGLPMGADIIYSKLLGRIVQPEEIADATLRIGALGDTTLYQVSLATDGRKAQIEPADVFVGLMEETVFIDLKIQLQLRPELAGQSDARATVTPEIRSALEDAANRTLAASQGKLAKADLTAAIRDTLGADGRFPLQLIAGNAVVLNAEFEETGRLLNNTEELTLEAQQVLELRNLVAEVPGALDV